jgi:cytochrome c-type biogenesis protein CcmH
MRPWWLNLSRWLGAIVFAVALALPPAVWADSLDDQARAIARELQCPVCENVTVADSNSPLAQQMRDIIRQKLQAGESREQILQYFVDRYGPGILSRPQMSGLGLGAWWMPVVGLIVGMGVLFLALSRSRRAPSGQIPASDLDPEVREVLEELDVGRRGDAR